MNVLITGAGGYVGRQVVEKLANDSRVKTLVASDIRLPEAAEQIDNVIYAKADIRSYEMKGLVTTHKIQTVVHLAAVMPKPKSDRELEYSIDVGGTKNILEACIAGGASKIIVSSSGAAYGYHADNPEWIKETDPIRGNPEFPYSDHKRMVEELLAQYREQHPELKQIILRIGTILGNSVNNQLSAFFERKLFITIKGSPSPFVFIWDQDVCGCIIQGVFSTKDGIYNVAGDGALSIQEIARMLRKTAIPIPALVMKMLLFCLNSLRLSPYGPEKINFLRYRPVLHNDKLKNDFGYTPQKTSREVFEYFLQNRK